MYDPDLLAAVRDQAHRQFGLLLTDDEATAAVDRTLTSPSWVRHSTSGTPALRAADAALDRWEADHERWPAR